MTDTLKLCECGCELPAPIAKASDKRRGHIAGQPIRFISGHNEAKGPLLDLSEEQKRERQLKYYREYNQKRKLDAGYQEQRRLRARKAVRTRRARIKNMVLEAKDKPCVDCGIKYPAQIMDLDHVHGEKAFNLAHASGGTKGYFSYQQIDEELQKCEPRCPTCHRMRHYREGSANYGN